MKIHTQPQGNITVLIPHGPLITDDTPDFRRTVEEAVHSEAKRVVVDLSDVPYLDSGGIELLLEMGDVKVAERLRPTFASLTETCLEALELTNVLPRLEVFDTVENALRSCQQ